MATSPMPIANDTMGLPDRVELTVYVWAGSKAPVPTTTALKDVWAIAGHRVSEYPDPATYDLIGKLRAQFKSGNDARDLSGLTPNFFKPGAPVQTVDDLVGVVLNAPIVIAPVVAQAQGLLDALAAGADSPEGEE